MDVEGRTQASPPGGTKSPPRYTGFNQLYIQRWVVHSGFIRYKISCIRSDSARNMGIDSTILARNEQGAKTAEFERLLRDIARGSSLALSGEAVELDLHAALGQIAGFVDFDTVVLLCAVDHAAEWQAEGEIC